MSLNRPASSALAPFLARAAARSSARHQSSRFPLARYARHQQPLLAILAAQRTQQYATDTSQTSTSTPGSFPPPGFNAEQAKQPIASEQASKQAAEAAEAQDRDELKPAPLQRAEPTSEPKTQADEKASLTELAAEKAAADKSADKTVATKKKDDKTLTLWQKVKKEAAHYRDGTKLLITEVKISFKLALKMASGYELTRREHRQLHRTVQDLGRLVPFSVFIIVPLGELLLPFALRLFPNLLPSTYEGQKSKETKAANLRAARKDVSKFLRQTLRETGLPISAANAQKEEFTEFFRKVRTTGEAPSTSDVIKVCKTFKDDLTLDNLSRPQLVAICRYMNLNTFGTDAMLRYHIRHRMRQIKLDDRAIAYEGVDSLSVPELQTASASRGLRTHGVSPGRLRDDLSMWLDLRLKYGVPSTLLVLSNAYVYATGKDAEFSSQIDALVSVLSSVPEELFHEIELEVSSAEGAATNKQRLEVLKEQQELIDEENQQGASESRPHDRDNIDDTEEPLAKKKE